MNCTFEPIAGTDRFVCTQCGFETKSMRTQAHKIIRKCDPSRKPTKLPPLGTRAVRYLSAIERWRAAGKPERTDEQVRQILEICETCEYFRGGKCSHSRCGCNVRSPEQERHTFLGRFIHRGLVNKLRMATERCPVGKWRAAGPIRICFATPVWAIGGVEQWLLQLHAAFDRQIARIVRIVVVEPKGLDAEGRKWITPDIEVIESSEIVDDGGFDLVVTWGLLELQKRISGLHCPVIDVQHGVCNSDVWQLPLVKQATEAYRRGRVTIAAVNEEAVGNFPPDVRDKITVIPNGVDPARVKTSGKKPFRVKENARITLFLGRISPEKNVQVLIDAVNYLGDPWHAVIAGPQRMQLSRLSDRIHLLGPHQAVGDLLAAAHVLVHPSSFESHCLAITEAWLAGVPVVSCDYPVNRRFTERHGELMWLVPVQPSPRELARMIERADRSDIRVSRARSVALNEYTAAVMARRWESLIQQVRMVSQGS